jgi:AraC family transcriptional regulator
VRISVEFPSDITARLMHDDSRPVWFRNHYELRDENVSRLAGELAQHARAGHPHGSLYSEDISLSLISIVLAHYGSAPAIEAIPRRGRFSAGQALRVRDYIENNLGADLRIEQVARELQMSPHVFARRFGSTFDKSPHQYVLHRRIERAACLLKQGYRGSIAELALSLGFSTQAHFTAAFKRIRGFPPKSARGE